MKQINLLDVAAELEMGEEFFYDIIESQSHDKALEALQRCKEVARRQRKVLALKYHPDRSGDMEKMKRVNNLCDLVEKLQVQRPKSAPVIHCYYYNYNTTSYTSAAGTWGSF